MRFALAVIAALANAAGPWLCCCGVAAVLGSAKPATAAVPTATTCTVTCPHCQEEAEDAAKTSSPTAPPKPCPWQERLAFAPLTVPPASDTGDAIDAINTDFQILGETVPLVSTPVVVGPRVNEMPFLTAETRLRVHHVLRC